MKKGTKRIVTVVLVLAVIVGIGLSVYPIISARYAESVYSEVQAEYNEVLEKADTTEIDNERAAADLYNQQLFAGEINRLEPESNGYFQQLDLSNNGVMAYVSIPKINVTLPVYHGTSDKVLKIGAGHMAESSLPVGGENTHSVITAHSGLASEPMFTDLELLEVGDVFQVEVLGEILTYEVYDIPEPVLPENVDSIKIQSGKDLCTLITCTPFGVNSHRLLVHGKRIPTPAEEETVVIQETEEDVQSDSVWLKNYQKGIITGICIAVGLLVVFVAGKYIWTFYCRKKMKYNEK